MKEKLLNYTVGKRDMDKLLEIKNTSKEDTIEIIDYIIKGGIIKTDKNFIQNFNKIYKIINLQSTFNYWLMKNFVKIIEEESIKSEKIKFKSTYEEYFYLNEIEIMINMSKEKRKIVVTRYLKSSEEYLETWDKSFKSVQKSYVSPRITGIKGGPAAFQSFQKNRRKEKLEEIAEKLLLKYTDDFLKKSNELSDKILKKIAIFKEYGFEIKLKDELYQEIVSIENTNF